MNCEDIARIADADSLRSLKDAERREADAHALSCRRCAVVWSAHVRLAELATPSMPAEVPLRLQALGGLPAHARRRYPLRWLTVIGGLVALAAAAGVMLWRFDGPKPPASQAAAGRIAPATGRDPEPATGIAAQPGTSNDAACMPAPSKLQEALSRLTDGLQDRLTERERMAEHVATRERLLASRDPEQLVAAALMTEPDDRVAPITRALAMGGNSPVLIWAAAQICDRAPDQGACPTDELAERLIAIDSGNGQAWVFAAVRRLKRGDDAGALDAMQRAATAAESRTYWAEMIALGGRAYAAAGDAPFGERVLSAMGNASSLQPDYSGYSKMCTTQSQASQAWAYACLGYGELTERRGDTYAGEATARGMQIQLLKQLNDPARLAAVTARQERARAEWSDETINADFYLMFSMPGLVASYLHVAAQQGESGARRWAHTEVARLRAKLPVCAASPPSQQCGFGESACYTSQFVAACGNEVGGTRQSCAAWINRVESAARPDDHVAQLLVGGAHMLFSEVYSADPQERSRHRAAAQGIFRQLVAADPSNEEALEGLAELAEDPAERQQLRQKLEELRRGPP